MARKAYKRRRTRKRATKTRYRRKRYYRKKAKTSTGKLWKYIKKATKSEVKRCDALYPPNWTYTTAVNTGTYADLFKPESRFLYTLRFANTGVGLAYSWSSHDPFNYQGQYRFWTPFQMTFAVGRGDMSNQRVGDKLFAKYVNFKIHFKSRNKDPHPHFSSLYFVQVARSVSGAYHYDSIMDAIWDGIPNFCRTGHTAEIYNHSIQDSVYEDYRFLMASGYNQKRRRYLKGIKVRKLHSYHSSSTWNQMPIYQDVKNTTKYGMSGTITPGPDNTQAYVGTVQSLTAQQNISLTPSGGGAYYPSERFVDQNISKLVPINKEWIYGSAAQDDDATGGKNLEEYKYYLIALCSDYIRNVDASHAGDADLEYFVNAELVYTDK